MLARMTFPLIQTLPLAPGVLSHLVAREHLWEGEGLRVGRSEPAQVPETNSPILIGTFCRMTVGGDRGVGWS
jgi:hypothetical protein